MESRVFRRSSLSIGSGQSCAHLPGGFSFPHLEEYWIPGAQISQHQGFPIGGVFRGLDVRSEPLIYIHLGNGQWFGVEFQACARLGQEVESQEETRRDSVNR
jgi:hypothetical protein